MVKLVPLDSSITRGSEVLSIPLMVGWVISDMMGDGTGKKDLDGSKLLMRGLESEIER